MPPAAHPDPPCPTLCPQGQGQHPWPLWPHTEPQPPRVFSPNLLPSPHGTHFLPCLQIPRTVATCQLPRETCLHSGSRPSSDLGSAGISFLFVPRHTLSTMLSLPGYFLHRPRGQSPHPFCSSQPDAGGHAGAIIRRPVIPKQRRPAHLHCAVASSPRLAL